MRNRFQSTFADKMEATLDKTAVVYSVILDINHPKYKDAGDIGGITFRMLSSTHPTATANDAELPVAYPFEKNFIDLPVINELVLLTNDNGRYFYKRFQSDVSGNKNISSAYDTILKKFGAVNSEDKQFSEGDKITQYKKTEDTQIARSNSDGVSSKNYNGYGTYFRPYNIHRLSLNEGDTLIESRFGQSIRFSAYNNPTKTFAPTLIIRNNESPLTQIIPATSGSIVEDINRDGSSIVLSSGEYVLPFIPGTINDKGTTDFQTQPKSFKPYPETLKGDQTLINSGRIILSAKNAEMLFYAKGNVGFISDGQFSIDTRLGMNVSVNDNISFVTNDRDFQVFAGNGSVFLGSKDLEPMVKGQKLVEILSELIQAIGDMQFLTPSGPSAIGPKNKPDFGKIHSKLNDILSKLNQTA
jgi:hypothetical protein